MSEVPDDPEAAARKAHKERLEIDKLELDIAKAKAEAAGKEPHWRWQRAQYLFIFVGVLSIAAPYLTYWKSVREMHEIGIRTATEHLQNGWPSGAVELAHYDDDGLLILVKSIDPTNATVQKSWPVVTLAALDELLRHKNDLDGYKTDLKKAMDDNHARLQELIQAAHGIPDRKSKEYGDALSVIHNHYCVQVALQKLNPAPPLQWPKTLADIEDLFGAPPHC
jgi:hypothetical protein